jgi:hypothetical protein
MLGGDVIISEHIAAHKWKDRTQQMFPDIPGSSKVSFISAVLLISKAQLATDPFLISWCMHSGVILTFIVALVLMLTTQASMFVFTLCWHFGHSYSYSELWELTLGSRGQTFPLVLLLILYYTYNAVCAWEMYAYPQSFLPVVWPGVPEILMDTWILVLIPTVLLIFPFSLVQKISELWSIAYLGFFATLVAFCALALHLVRCVEEIGFDPDGQLMWFNGDILVMLEAASSFASSYFLHPFLPLVLRDMERATVGRCMNVAWTCNILCLIVSFGSAALGSFFFTEVENYENIFDYLNPKAPEVIVGNIALYVISLATCCYYTQYLAKLFLILVLGYETESRVANVLSTLVQITGYIFSVFMGDRVSETIVLIGDTGSYVLVYFLPPLFYLKQYKMQRFSAGMMSVVVAAFGIPFAVALTWQAIEGFMESWIDFWPTWWVASGAPSEDPE